MIFDSYVQICALPYGFHYFRNFVAPGASSKLYSD